MEDCYDLIRYLLNVPDCEEIDDNDLYFYFFDKYNIQPEDLEVLIEDLLPLIHIEKSFLTDTTYKGFADVDNDIWLIKIKAND